MTSMPNRPDRRHFIRLAGAAVAIVAAPPVLAAGRTYKSQKEDNRVHRELCRLRKREYVDGGTNCIYARQSGGKDAVIRVDGSKVRCQAEYQCKRDK
ncbi:MAG: hypothetical protein VW446_09965 [Alphaproteobacteria bacterium]